MAYEIRPNSGSLFKNDKKETEQHPNARGSALIGGVEYWVNAWTKKDKNGNPWQSLAFKPKEERQERPAAKQESKPRKDSFDDMDSDIPF